jgi:parallel beta-helix repeat protein
MKRTISASLALIMILSMFIVFCPIENVKGATIYVDESGSIQDAITDSNPGDTIYVYGGTYTENLTIGKSINLISTSGASNTIIRNFDGNLDTIEISANNVNISGFTIRQTGDSHSCIKLDTVTNCKIENNIIKNANGANGIYLIDSYSNMIQSNTLENSYIGIYLELNSNTNTIINNNIQSNIMYGIFITVSSTDNKIYLNDFSDNYDSNARDMGSNNWDYGSQGNYWDDYNDYDSDSNGIGDNPYDIEGGSNKDNYPLGDFLSSNTEPTAYIDSISPNPASQGETINFNGHGSDDGSIVAWEWKANGAVLSTGSEDYSTSGLSPGTYTISYRVQDNNGYWSSAVTRTLVISSPNQVPTAYILEPTTAVTEYYGENITFSGIGTDDGEIVEYSWRSDIDGALSELAQFTKNNLKVGEHTIYFKVRDDYGEWSTEVSIDVTILSNPTNNPPVADAGGPYTGYVNQTVTFNGSGSYDADATDGIVSYQWDFGDETTGGGVAPEHTYTSEGNYTVELTVFDNNGEQSNSTTYAAINIQPNGQNGNDDGPGFEIILVIIALALIVFYRRKKRK